MPTRTRFHPILVPFVLLGLLLGTALASHPAVRAADQRVDQGDFRGAIAMYQNILANNPDDVEALYKLAKTETYLAGTLSGDEAEAFYEQAAEHARAAIALDPDEAEAHFELSRALGRLAQFRGVLQSLNLAGQVKAELERTLELNPEHAGAYHALALWHLEVPWIAGGRRGQVRPLFERAIELDPELILRHVDYAEALLELGDREAAREHLEIALQLEPQTFNDRQDQERARRLMDENF